MASHTVNVAGANDVGTGLVTLAAGVADTITFDTDLPTVDLINSGTVDAWYTLDGTAPTVGGAKSYYLPAGSVDSRQPLTSSPTVVTVISAGAATIRVQRGY